MLRPIRQAWHHIPDLSKTERWSYGQLLEFQEQRLRKVVRFAYENVLGYRKLYNEAGLDIRAVRKLDDLEMLPEVTREMVQNNPDFFIPSMIARRSYTGGSTGQPLEYYLCYAALCMRSNVHERGWRWAGQIPGKTRLAILGSSQGKVLGNNVLNLSGNMDEATLEDNAKAIVAFHPHTIRGYVNTLYIQAKYCIEKGYHFDGIYGINPISENLYDYQRETIEQAFGAKIFEEYVCNDGGTCAWECSSHEGLHYFMERAIIQTDRNGEMLVTDLWNTCMPFIRYRNGDSVRFLDKPCSCGIAHPLMRVQGRTNDVLIGPNGAVSPAFLVHHGVGLASATSGKTHFTDGIRAVQYVQKPGFQLQVNLVKTFECTDGQIQQFLKRLEGIVQGLEIHLNLCEELPASKKGKRHFIVNEDEELMCRFQAGS